VALSTSLVGITKNFATGAAKELSRAWGCPRSQSSARSSSYRTSGCRGPLFENNGSIVASLRAVAGDGGTLLDLFDAGLFETSLATGPVLSSLIRLANSAQSRKFASRMCSAVLRRNRRELCCWAPFAFFAFRRFLPPPTSCQIELSRGLAYVGSVLSFYVTYYFKYNTEGPEVRRRWKGLGREQKELKYPIAPIGIRFNAQIPRA